jgi:hypothetical protein
VVVVLAELAVVADLKLGGGRRTRYRAATAYAEISKDERAAAHVREWKSYLSRS